MENRVSQGLACGSINPTRTRIDAGNAGETPASHQGGAESGASDFQSGARWEQVRALIADCPELPEEARQLLIAQGDEAAGVSLRNACREIPQDHQEQEGHSLPFKDGI